MSLQLVLSIALALLPAIIWSTVFFDRKDEYSKLYFLVFLGGTLTVLPILGMQAGYLKVVEHFPDFDFVRELKQSITNYNLWILILYAFVGMSEELVKFYIVRFSDRTHPELITTINRSLKFGILSALGFAFSENIIYFYNIWKNLGADQLLAPVLFRSTFTVCAHMMFSGIFAYHYGLSKFAEDYIDFKRWKGEKVGLNEYQVFKSTRVIKGLFLAMGLHATFNILLEKSQVLPVIILVVAMFLYIMYLLNRNTGNLTFILANKHHSTMAAKDQEVVMELIGMWYEEGRYQEVEGICERLLKRDPDNNVVKLFKAATQDKLKNKTDK